MEDVDTRELRLDVYEDTFDSDDSLGAGADVDVPGDVQSCVQGRGLVTG